MVVDILEAKLEREYSDSTAQLLKKVNGIREMNTDTDEEQDDTGPVHYPGTSLPSEICATKDAFELPLHWKETKKNEVHICLEYYQLSELFFNLSDCLFFFINSQLISNKFHMDILIVYLFYFNLTFLYVDFCEFASLLYHFYSSIFAHVRFIFI